MDYSKTHRGAINGTLKTPLFKTRVESASHFPNKVHTVRVSGDHGSNYLFCKLIILIFLLGNIKLFLHKYNHLMLYLNKINYLDIKKSYLMRKMKCI